MQIGTPSRTALPSRIALAVVVLVASLGFWAAVLLADHRATGYDSLHDTLSALAARDVEVRWIGIVAGVLLAVSHVAAAALVRTFSRASALLFLGAGLAELAGLVAAPITCPNGAAGCSDPLSGRGEQTTLDVLHRDLVVLYGALFFLATVALVVQLVRRRRWTAAALCGVAATASILLAIQLTGGDRLGLWERGWVGANTLMLSVMAVSVIRPQRLSLPRLGEALVVLGVGGMVLLLPLGISAQPRWDVRNDLVSGLAANGAQLPWIGRTVILALAAAYAGAALILLERRTRAVVTAAACALLAAVGAVGIALVPIDCPRGASGCSGPDSGRAYPRPVEDVIHRDLVVVLEVGSLLMVLLITWRLWVSHRRGWATATGVAAVASPVLLGLQQRGHDIGYYQLSWLASLCVPLVVIAVISYPRLREMTWLSPEAPEPGARIERDGDDRRDESLSSA